VYTPNVGRGQLWQTSGHLGFYRENMFAGMEMDEQEYFAKPMNCPFHIMIYKNALRSYRELPMRLGELGTVYRYERPGVLHGLLRVRGFTQDDAHIFCRPEQVEDEIVEVLKLNQHVLHSFGFHDFELFLSTRPEKSVGRDEDWEHATAALGNALDRMNLRYELDEGGGAFYGPKIDWKIKDALGRSWQCSTVQFDFNMSERFDLTYIGEDGAQHRPYMVHRALLGSLERFFGVLLEHYGGALPLWLAPVQALVIPIADRHLDYAESMAAQLRQRNLRIDVDSRRESMRRKIRDAEVQKVPYMLVVGDRDIEAGAASIRERSAGDLGPKAIAEIATMLEERRDART
jgi:threonyl-tRNA synthetase